MSDEIKGRRNVDGSGSWKKSLEGIDEDGATFRSYHDGSLKRLTPEGSIKVRIPGSRRCPTPQSSCVEAMYRVES